MESKASLWAPRFQPLSAFTLYCCRCRALGSHGHLAFPTAREPSPAALAGPASHGCQRCSSQDNSNLARRSAGSRGRRSNRAGLKSRAWGSPRSLWKETTSAPSGAQWVIFRARHGRARAATRFSPHRDTFFRPLRNINQDDIVTLTTLQGQYRYRILSTQVVSPDNVSMLDPSQNEILTLIICHPFYFVGAAPNRFIVRAERVH
jgi:Sortase domain